MTRLLSIVALVLSANFASAAPVDPSAYSCKIVYGVADGSSNHELTGITLSFADGRAKAHGAFPNTTREFTATINPKTANDSLNRLNLSVYSIGSDKTASFVAQGSFYADSLPAKFMLPAFENSGEKANYFNLVCELVVAPEVKVSE